MYMILIIKHIPEQSEQLLETLHETALLPMCQSQPTGPHAGKRQGHGFDLLQSSASHQLHAGI
jgi:hypothetical protein